MSQSSLTHLSQEHPTYMSGASILISAMGTKDKKEEKEKKEKKQKTKEAKKEARKEKKKEKKEKKKQNEGIWQTLLCQIQS